MNIFRNIFFVENMPKGLFSLPPNQITYKKLIFLQYIFFAILLFFYTFSIFLLSEGEGYNFLPYKLSKERKNMTKVISFILLLISFIHAEEDRFIPTFTVPSSQTTMNFSRDSVSVKMVSFNTVKVQTRDLEKVKNPTFSLNEKNHMTGEILSYGLE